MAESSVIATYLADLDAALHLPRRSRQRVLAESHEHLRDAVHQIMADHVDPIEAERAAVERFGPARLVAAAFHRQAAARVVQSSIVSVASAVMLAVIAQAIGSPLFWQVSGSGLRATGRWPAGVKDGVILASDLRAIADVITVAGLTVAASDLIRRRRRGTGPTVVTAVSGLAAAGAVGVSALTGLAEVALADGFRPTGVREGAVVALLLSAACVAGGAVVWAVWRLWVVRSGWLPADGAVNAVRVWWSRMTPRAQGALRRGLRVAIPMAVVVTIAAAGVEAIRQGNLRGGANHPQVEVARDSVRLLAHGARPDSVAQGPRVDLARSLGLHVTVIDATGRVLASTAVLDGKTPVPPMGVLRSAGRRSDVVTWQPRPAVRVATVASAWSGPSGRGTIVVGRSLKLVEQRESRLLRRVTLGWLIAMIVTFLATAAAARWQSGGPRPARHVHRVTNRKGDHS